MAFVSEAALGRARRRCGRARKLVQRLFGGPDGPDHLVAAPGIVVASEYMIEAHSTRVRIWHPLAP